VVGESVPPDRPGVIAPVPVVFAAAFVAGISLDAFSRIGGIHLIPRPLRATIALICIAFGVWVMVKAIRSFRRINTHTLPWFPASALAVCDIYSKTRNPMYEGMMAIVFGFGVLLRSDWTILLLIPAVIIVHYGVVRREERYLERKFGDEYRRYKKEVPRYGWRLLM
jgi:protein-S-isoprenylcysteine O-methyltransferase Ste14